MPTTKPKAALKVAVVAIAKVIVEDGFNPRTLVEEVKLNELAASIADRGLLEPLGVSPMPGGKFKLNSGHRRYAACLRAKVTEVPIAIADRDEAERLVDAIASNMYREDLSPYDEAMAFKRLKEGGLSNKGIAEKLQVSDKLVADRLVIADLPPVLAERFRDRWPTSLARTLKTMCELSGGVALATVVADRIDASDGSIERALENLRHDPVHYVGQLARTQGKPIPGVIPVQATGGKAGGGYRGGPRWGAWSRDHLDPAILGKVSPALKDKINALRSKDRPQDYNNTYYRLFLDQAAIDSLRAANVLYAENADKSRGVCIALDALVAVCEPIIEADYAAFLKAQAAEKRSVAKGPEAQAKADEKAKGIAETNGAREFNLMLGEQLAQHFSEVSPTLEHMRAVCRLALLGAVSSMEGIQSIDAMVKRGMRYVVPGWHQEVVTKSTGAISWRYPGEGTKNRSGEKTRADETPEALFWEWWNLAQTPAQVIGRTMQAIAAAMYAKETAVPESRRVRYTPLSPSYGSLRKGSPEQLVHEHLSGLVTPKLPKAGEKPKRSTPAAGSAEAKRRAAKAAQTRAANAPKTDAAKAARKDPKAAKALALIVETPGIAIPEIAEKLGVAQNTLYRLLPGLQNDGKIVKNGRGWHPAPVAA